MSERLMFGSPVDGVLDRLYALQGAQHDTVVAHFMDRAADGSMNWAQFDERTNTFLRDKQVSLDRDKAEFCYHVCRALRARRVVEAGTSFGVSTLFLAAAVRDTLRREAQGVSRHSGVVIGTEYEPEKARTARAHFAEAGLADLIDLREGDLRETLVDVEGPIDFMLVDIWTPMARPALSLMAAHLREGAVVICDNTLQFQEAYCE